MHALVCSVCKLDVEWSDAFCNIVINGSRLWVDIIFQDQQHHQNQIEKQAEALFPLVF